MEYTCAYVRVCFDVWVCVHATRKTEDEEKEGKTNKQSEQEQQHRSEIGTNRSTPKGLKKNNNARKKEEMKSGRVGKKENNPDRGVRSWRRKRETEGNTHSQNNCIGRFEGEIVTFSRIDAQELKKRTKKTRERVYVWSTSEDTAIEKVNRKGLGR